MEKLNFYLVTHSQSSHMHHELECGIMNHLCLLVCWLWQLNSLLFNWNVLQGLGHHRAAVVSLFILFFSLFVPFCPTYLTPYTYSGQSVYLRQEQSPQWRLHTWPLSLSLQCHSLTLCGSTVVTGNWTFSTPHYTCTFKLCVCKCGGILCVSYLFTMVIRVRISEAFSGCN